MVLVINWLGMNFREIECNKEFSTLSDIIYRVTHVFQIVIYTRLPTKLRK